MATKNISQSAQIGTKWRLNPTNGQLEKQDPFQSTYNKFVIKGINYTPDVPGFNNTENYYDDQDVFSNFSLFKKFCDNYGKNGIKGNVIRVYVSPAGSTKSQASKYLYPGSDTGYGSMPIFNVVLTSGVVTNVQVLDPGSKIPPQWTSIVIYNGGAGGGGAIVNCTIIKGSVGAVTIVNGGSGYTSKTTAYLYDPTVVYPATPDYGWLGFTLKFSQGGNLNSSQKDEWKKCMDYAYQNGIYFLYNIWCGWTWDFGYTNYSTYTTAIDIVNTSTIRWEEGVMANCMRIAEFTKNHPTSLGIIIGNESNQNLGFDLYDTTGAKRRQTVRSMEYWHKFANKVAKEVKAIAPNIIFGCDDKIGGSATAALLTSHNSGWLNDCDVHFCNAYPGESWLQHATASGANIQARATNSLTAPTTTNLWADWTPTNQKPVIVTETGVSTYNVDSTQPTTDQTTAPFEFQSQQATNAANLWNEIFTPTGGYQTINQFGSGKPKCLGICYFSSFDNNRKTQGLDLTGVDGFGDLPLNDGIYTRRHTSAGDDTFRIPPSFKHSEQTMGWWKLVKSNSANTVFPAAKSVVATMTSTWSQTP